MLARCHRALSLLAERSIADQGLCLTDFMLLEALLHRGPLTISEIQAKVLLASGSMTAAVDRVEKRGLLVRKTIPQDRRARVLDLTPEGRRLIQTAYKEHTKDLEAAMQVLDNKERQELYNGAKKLGRFVSEIADRPKESEANYE